MFTCSRSAKRCYCTALTIYSDSGCPLGQDRSDEVLIRVVVSDHLFASFRRWLLIDVVVSGYSSLASDFGDIGGVVKLSDASPQPGRVQW